VGISWKNVVPHDLRAKLGHQAEPGVYRAIIKNRDWSLKG